MAMDFELTITGLCLLVLKSKDDEPATPAGAEIFCPAAHNHRSVLSYAPENVVANFEPELVVDEAGKRFASIEMKGKVWSVTLQNGAGTFSARWGKPNASTPGAGEEDWLNWVPKLADIGFKGFTPGAAGQLPTNAGTRLTLAPGELEARDVLREPPNGPIYTWMFPAVGKTRAVANHMIYTARGIQKVVVSGSGGQQVKAEWSSGTFRMALSNDLEHVPLDYNSPGAELQHLAHLEKMGGINGKFAAPKLQKVPQTAKPICNGIVFIDKS
jgi:hypothetical protein